MKSRAIICFAALALGLATTQASVIINSFTVSKLILNEGDTLTASVTISSSYTNAGEGLEQITGHVDFHTSNPAFGELSNYNGVAVTLSATCDPYIMPNNGIFNLTLSGFAMERKYNPEMQALVGGYTSEFSSNGPTVVVNNVAPTIVTPQPDVTLDLSIGGLVSFGAWATDPGMNDVLTYAWDLNGDHIFNDAFGATTDMLDLSGWTPNTYAAQLRVDDGDGGYAYQSFDLRLVPEPASTILAGLAACTIAALRRRRIA